MESLREEVSKLREDKALWKDVRDILVDEFRNDRRQLKQEVESLKEEIVRLKEMVSAIQELIIQLSDDSGVFGGLASWKVRAVNPHIDA